MIKAIIFDMDGVLIDAKEWHYESLNRALALFGFGIGRYDHLVTFDGLPTKKKLEMLSLERGLPRQLHDFLNHMKQIYTIEEILTKCKPQFHHQYALAKLKQEGFLLAVCSNSVRRTIEMMLGKADLLSFFEFFLSNEDVINAKPHPEIYIKAIERLGVKPENCLIVEDNENGLRAARSSGAHVLQVSGVSDVNYTALHRKIQEIKAERA